LCPALLNGELSGGFFSNRDFTQNLADYGNFHHYFDIERRRDYAFIAWAIIRCDIRQRPLWDDWIQNAST
jgi:hypothetical protein